MILYKLFNFFQVGAVGTLMKSSMYVKKETTLKSILSALWNLSSHCSENKAEICAVEGALPVSSFKYLDLITIYLNYLLVCRL